ncbi:MAG: lytic transglycosylase domain-containing protein [bacterium]|nr:lytic transglycosylase domain-containing protein [bacterium]
MPLTIFIALVAIYLGLIFLENLSPFPRGQKHIWRDARRALAALSILAAVTAYSPFGSILFASTGGEVPEPTSAARIPGPGGNPPEAELFSPNSLILNDRLALHPDDDIYWNIHYFSSIHKIDPLLIQAVIRVESNCNPKAVSRRGAMGLMQINGITARHLGVQNPFDIQQNIEGGTRYLKILLQRHGWNLWLALASYNAGPETVKRYRGMPPYDETRRYVWKVIREYRGLQRVHEAYKNTRKGETPGPIVRLIAPPPPKNIRRPAEAPASLPVPGLRNISAEGARFPSAPPAFLYF